MTSPIVEVDFSQPDCVSKVYPGLPLTSQSSNQGFHVAHYRLPAHETPVYSSDRYIIGIHLDRPEIVQQWWADNCFSQEKLIYGDISIYPVHCPQRQRWSETTNFIEMYLAPDLFTKAVQELFDRDSPTETLRDRIDATPHLTLRDPLIQQLGLTLKADLDSNKTTSENRLYIDSIANLLVVHLLKHYFIPNHNLSKKWDGLPQTKLKAVMIYIHDNLEQDIGLDDLAAVAEMGTHYFASLFKRSTGQPPHQYLTTCRIEKAKSLLKNRQLSIAEVCYQVGFQCQSHFTKVFRKHTGTTPGNYRATL